MNADSCEVFTSVRILKESYEFSSSVKAFNCARCIIKSIDFYSYTSLKFHFSDSGEAAQEINRNAMTSKCDFYRKLFVKYNAESVCF